MDSLLLCPIPHCCLCSGFGDVGYTQPSPSRFSATPVLDAFARDNLVLEYDSLWDTPLDMAQPCLVLQPFLRLSNLHAHTRRPSHWQVSLATGNQL